MASLTGWFWEILSGVWANLSAWASEIVYFVMWSALFAWSWNWQGKTEVLREKAPKYQCGTKS
jgi:hypothetical protein